MPDDLPTPLTGRPAARGPGRPSDSDPADRVEGLDAPTVRSSPAGSASGAAPARRLSAKRPDVVPLPIPGERVDVFELEESIGAGGMGAVFRAIDTKLDRQVALKILPPDQAVDPEVVLRYHQEGRAAARLDHENIARVYTIGDDGKYHYIAFEYIEGTTIRQRVERDGPLPVGDAINYTLQITNALVHAAERGVVHRDIKPSNIIVTPQGRAKLVDMGLARRFERGDDTGLTQSGMTLGTFDYISPEQARDPRDVDVRGDLYSLGCTLFHMLSGRPPFPEGTVLQKLLQHQEEPPPDIRRLNPTVPDDLAAILVKLMAKDRDRRYQTPELLVRDLLTVAGSLGLRSLNPEGLVWMAPGATPGWLRHVVWGVPGLAFLLILAILAWWGDESMNPGRIVGGLPPAGLSPAPKLDRGNPPGPIRPTQATELEAPGKFAVDSSEDLLRVLAEASPGSTILLADRGPYDLRASKSRRLAGLDLTIRAGPGVRPVLRLPRDLAADESSPTALLDLVGGRLTLEGLEFLIDGGEAAQAIRAEDAELVVRRCWFGRQGASPPRSRPAAIQIRSTSRPAGRAPEERSGASLALESSEFDGGQAGVIATGPVEIGIRDCTFGPAPADLASLWTDNPEAGLVAVEIRLSHVSVLAGAGPVFRFGGTAARVRVADSAFAPPTVASPITTLVAIDAADRLDWRGVDNLYGRVGAYLRPGGLRPPTRTFEAWADDLLSFREAGSVSTEAPPWEARDPLGALASGGPESTRAFRLVLARTSPSRVGARLGPAGPLPAPAILATAPVAVPGPDPLGLAERREKTDPPRTREVAAAIPPATAPDPPKPKAADPGDEMMEMPLELPGRLGGPPPDDGPDAPEPIGDLVRMPRPIDPERPVPAALVPPVAAIPPRAEVPVPVPPAAEPGVIQNAEAFLEALDRPAPGPRTVLIIAANADWTLPGCRPRGPAAWEIHAERGMTRPRIRFRPDPAASTPESWPAWMVVPPGGLRLEGVDLVLAAGDASRSPARRWAAFAIRPGPADLSLTNCTVTIEGDALRSAAVALLPVEPADEPSPATRVRIKDGLLRVGDDLVDVAPGRSLDLDLDNAAVATGGTLVHGHGLSRGKPAGPIKMALRLVTARLAGGLVQLQSAPGEPELPVADVDARDTILATNDPEVPLFRVDGQGDLDQLRDRIHWEGRSVAYHQINLYRRDQTTQPGALPTRFDRDYWKAAVGRHEESAFHGDLKFLTDWDPDRSAWTLRPDDVRLRPESQAAALGAGVDLMHVPSPPG